MASPWLFSLVSRQYGSEQWGPERLVAWTAARIAPKSAQSFLRKLQLCLPFSEECGHLKRVKKCGDTLLVLLTPTTSFSTVLPDTRASLQDDILELCEVMAARAPARSKEQHVQDNAHWPCVCGHIEEPPSLTPPEQAAASVHVSAVLAASESASDPAVSADGAAPAKLPAIVIVDPVTNTIVAAANCQTRPGVYANPLHSAVMRCVEAVAEEHRRLATLPAVPGQVAPYLCTGLDLYSSHELDAMDAMALVHSRIRRVVYVHSDPVFGALGSRLLLHEESKLNHHYTVYQATPQTTTISGK